MLVYPYILESIVDRVKGTDLDYIILSFEEFNKFKNLKFKSVKTNLY